MTSQGILILSLIFSLASIDAQRGVGVRVCRVSPSVKDVAPLAHATSLQNPDNGVTTDLKSWKSHRRGSHHHRHLRNAQGILNIIGWGTLLPIGVIIARYFRKFPIEYDDWYSLHIRCQITGHVLGSIGWVLGMWLGNASKQYTSKTHRILGTIIFAFTTIQMFAICLQPKKEGRKCWEIYHCLLGYALIALIVANIFQGVKNQSSAQKWKWFYVGELGVLAIISVVLELFRFIKGTFGGPM